MKQIKSDNSNILIKAKNFFLYSDGTLPGTFVEMNGKKVEGINALNIDFNAKNSLPTINMDFTPMTNTQKENFEINGLRNAFSDYEEIYEIETPIFDFEEQWNFGILNIFKRNEETYNFVITDKFLLFVPELKRIIPAVDSVKFQSVVFQYLHDIIKSIFLEHGVPTLELKPYSENDIELMYKKRTYSLEVLTNSDFLVYSKTNVFSGKNNEHIELPLNDFTNDKIKEYNNYFQHDKLENILNEINDLFSHKNLKLNNIVLNFFTLGVNVYADLSMIIPSVSQWKTLDGYEFFSDAYHILGGDLEVYQMNDEQKSILSQEYLKFLSFLL